MTVQKRIERPDLLALASGKSGYFPALLESQSLNKKIGKQDILFAAPCIEMVAFDGRQLHELLTAVNRTFDHKTTQNTFQFGWFVYFSYETAYYLDDKLAELRTENVKEPLAVAIYCQGAVVYEHYSKACHIYAENQLTLKQIEAVVKTIKHSNYSKPHLQAINEADGQQFIEAVEYAKELIVAGDIYQANLSRQYLTSAINKVTAFDVFKRLKQANPAPFAGLLQLGDFAVISSSPERLFQIDGQSIETRPIAGTRPRGVDSAADQKLMAELIKTPKERAEHIMLIDLERNDLGRVCEIGSVEVDELMAIESYQHVHHIVSNVRGKLKANVSFVGVLQALFPGGTITGCPKIRCMQVIREVEQRDRGCYTGSMGYINHDGHVDLNILIRTIALQNNQLTFSAGAGIVFDSDPVAELEETRHKAKGMMNALDTEFQSAKSDSAA